MDNGTLLIRRISFRDGGDYECLYTTADPFQGVLISSYTVKVAHAGAQPAIKEDLVEFVIKPENQTVIAGSTAVISCEAHYEGKELNTTWQHGDKVLTMTSVLVIPRATTLDSGEYECVVSDTGQKNSTFLTVHGTFCSIAHTMYGRQMSQVHNMTLCSTSHLYRIQSYSVQLTVPSFVYKPAVSYYHTIYVLYTTDSFD